MSQYDQWIAFLEKIKEKPTNEIVNAIEEKINELKAIKAELKVLEFNWTERNPNGDG